MAAQAQRPTLRGQITDSVNRKNLYNSSIAVLRQSDSVLVRFTRTNPDGRFSLVLPDTGLFLLSVSHPGFAAYSDAVNLSQGGETDLGAIYLTLKSKLLEEIIVRKTIPAIRFKGDTMVFKADSFKVKPGASVEDLLKQMPGFQIDRNGQITAQGERVQKVLVDGEEFFSDDPTIATKNLMANMVDDVEVFNKKSEQSEFTGIDDGSKTKTINLKLKEDKKNGYFGKLEAGSDMNRYWNNSAMGNYFKGKKKITGYGIMSNNGKTGLNWQDNMNYGGLGGGGLETGVSDDGGMYISFNNNGDEFSNSNFQGEGLPKSWSLGVNFADKWDRDAKHLNGNVRYNKLNNNADIKNRTQYILPDTTFFQDQDNQVFQSRERTRAEGLYDVKLDSSSSLKVTVAGSMGQSTLNNRFQTASLSEDNKLVNSSLRNTTNEGEQEQFSSTAIYRKKFRKAGHTLSAQIRQDYGTLSYTHPLSTRSYLEFNYGLAVRKNFSDRRTLEKADPNAEKYDQEVGGLSNTFDYTGIENSGGINYRFNKAKKLSLTVGASVAGNTLEQQDLRRDTSLTLRFVNFFPRANANFTLKKNKNLRISYSGRTQQPSIEQLQPVIDNNDPLNIAIGNPDLQVAVAHNLNLNFGGYDFLSESGFWSSVSTDITQHAFSTRDFVDSLGRRVFQAINVKGVYNVNAYLNYNFRIKKKWGVSINVDGNYGQNVNEVNGVENQIRNGNIGGGFYLNRTVEKKYNFWTFYNFSQNFSSSSIQEDLNANYWTQTFGGEYTIQLPWRLEYGGEISANFRQKTEIFPDNNNAILVNQWIDRKMGKEDAFRFRIYAFDVFNQNIGFRRTINTNLVSERTYNTVNRYLMFSLLWNFSKNAKPMSF
ncbi:MAG: TonB-dependent receptor family protein [Chitinophagaceae bacterium]|nr:TonB-dependent receptor family protein [Chitinophagaceae bacterium]